MAKLIKQIRATMILGALALAAGIAGHLALTDIYHGEADVSLEWSLLRICALILLAFIVSALIILKKAARALPR
jgi:hypothetical protein